jgi:hypothetical protein
VRRVIATILSGKSVTYEDGVNIRLSEFDARSLVSFDTNGNAVAQREKLDALTRTTNREIMVLGKRDSGAIIFAMQSVNDDKFLDSIFSTISQSARTQVTAARPALYLIGLNEIGMDGMTAVAHQDADSAKPPSALRVGVSKFLQSDKLDHVVGVGFLSSSSLIPRSGGNVESAGSAYVFPRRESALWHDDFSGLFS